MKKVDDKEIIAELKQDLSNIPIRESFKKELEYSLVQRFTTKEKTSFLLPVASALVCFVVGLLLLTSQLNENNSVDIPKYDSIFIHSSDFDVDVRQHLFSLLLEKGIPVVFVDDRTQSMTDENVHFMLQRSVDSARITTTAIQGEEMGRILFVLQGDSTNFEHDYEIALTLHEQSEKLYPGLSRGVLEISFDNEKDARLLIEIGNRESSEEELMKTIELFALVIESWWEENT
ncbi:stage II sporulation protein P [Alkalihalobacillus sp. LMS39]|uniref:stage II sporulation protein P n=1 Tax=Alkalihalobacillus sp. LMS39 TaxID=2924032 RepID=UPI001FB3552D|nr:stage II sporulation protein P [Alkalihalobacillus sp. LMS39]UOE95809.1 stage II sporulation protein P [Alkalihalobacillus sp. LMS39]